MPDFELQTTDNLFKESAALYDDADHRGDGAGAGLLSVGRNAQPLQCRVLGVGSGRSEWHDVLGQAVEFEFMGNGTWAVDVLAAPRLRLPFVPDAAGVSRPFGLHRHFTVSFKPG